MGNKHDGGQVIGLGVSEKGSRGSEKVKLKVKSGVGSSFSSCQFEWPRQRRGCIENRGSAERWKSKDQYWVIKINSQKPAASGQKLNNNCKFNVLMY